MNSSPDRSKYLWPKLVLAGFLVGVALAALAIFREAQRVKHFKANAASQMTNVARVENPPPPPGLSPTNVPAADWTNGMVRIAGGTFLMGSDDGKPDEKPVHEVHLDEFWIDQTEVTNERFDAFVRATGYITIAERKPDPKEFPDVPPEKLVPGSVVFSPPKEEVPLDNHYLWWKYVEGANWRQPEGPGSTIQGRERHPVVHVCWVDAQAFASWAGKRLPTEAEWECAARAGIQNGRYIWGDEQTPDGKRPANLWQGRFPTENDLSDGFQGTAPVASYPSNGFGLYDMAGNVWEWCQDWYAPDYYQHSPKRNPAGPDTSFDPEEPGVMKRVQRGGSFLCSDSYCIGYLPGARMKASPDTGLSHSGFRCARSL